LTDCEDISDNFFFIIVLNSFFEVFKARDEAMASGTDI